MSFENVTAKFSRALEGKWEYSQLRRTRMEFYGALRDNIANDILCRQISVQDTHFKYEWGIHSWKPCKY